MDIKDIKTDYYSSSAFPYPTGYQHVNGHLCVSCELETQPDHLKHLSGGPVRHKLGWARPGANGWDSKLYPFRELITRPVSQFVPPTPDINQPISNPLAKIQDSAPVNFPDNPPTPNLDADQKLEFEKNQEAEEPEAESTDSADEAKTKTKADKTKAKADAKAAKKADAENNDT